MLYRQQPHRLSQRFDGQICEWPSTSSETARYLERITPELVTRPSMPVSQLANAARGLIDVGDPFPRRDHRQAHIGSRVTIGDWEHIQCVDGIPVLTQPRKRRRDHRLEAKPSRLASHRYQESPQNAPSPYRCRAELNMDVHLINGYLRAFDLVFHHVFDASPRSRCASVFYHCRGRP